MEDIAQKISNLMGAAEVASDETGCLAVVARLLEALDPSLVLLADQNGKLIAAENLGSQPGLEAAECLAPELLAHLGEGATCTFQQPGDWEPRLAFGICLGSGAQRAILGGLVRMCERSQGQLQSIWPVLSVCGELARYAILGKSDQHTLRTRIRHLLAEQDTLKASHTEAMTDAIEQHEERLRGQQQQMDLEELCQTAEATSEAKTRFLANISHELRTALHSILSFATFGIKRARSAGGEDLLQYFEKIERSGQLLLNMVNDLLDLAKLESDKTRFSFNRVDLRVLIVTAAEEFSPAAAHRNIRIECLKADFDESVVADQDKITQVIRNLLSNAIKFSPDDSTIEIGTQRQEQSVTVFVGDRGIGIPEDGLVTVFDKFIRSGKTRTGEGGAELGLAICREIITAHKGRIWAENRPGGGTVFSFEIPLEPQHARLMGKDHRTVPPPLPATPTLPAEDTPPVKPW